MVHAAAVGEQAGAHRRHARGPDLPAHTLALPSCSVTWRGGGAARTRGCRHRRSGPVRWLLLLELVALAGVDDVPLGAEIADSLAGHVAGLGVLGVVVQRPAVGGALLGAGGAARHAEPGRVDALSRRDLVRGEQRRPRRGALAGAGGLAGLVLLEQVERHVLA